MVVSSRFDNAIICWVQNHLSNSASLQQQLQQQHNLRSSALEQLVSELRATNAVAAQVPQSTVPLHPAVDTTHVCMLMKIMTVCSESHKDGGACLA